MTGQSVVPFVLPCGLTVPCVLPRGSDSGSERGAEAQAAASPDPVSGWEGAPRHFLVPTGLRRGMRLSLRGHGTGFLPAGAERGRGNSHCHAMRGCGGSSRVETLSRRYGPKHHPMWDGPLACESDADHPACGCWPVMVCWLQYGPSIMSPLRAWSPGKDQLRVHSDVLPPIPEVLGAPQASLAPGGGGQGLCWPGQQCFQVQCWEQGSVHWCSRPANGVGSL